MATDRRGFLGGLLTTTLGGTSILTVVGPAAATAPRSSVMVLECHVAGTTYAVLPDAYEEGLMIQHPLVCVREPENAADPLAIRIQDESGRKLGYVPRVKNEVLARLMDAGVTISAEVLEWERLGSWLKIQMRVSARL